MAGNYFDTISEKETQWLQEKWACFSASEIDRLNASGTRDMTAEEKIAEKARGGKRTTIATLFGKTALTYIEEVATEAVTIFNTDGAFENRAMRKGKINEPISFVELKRRLGMKDGILEYYGGENPVFIKYTKDSGASPDVRAVKPDGGTSFGAELKNRDAKQHFYYLRNIRTAAELKELDSKSYGQCQFGMMTCKCDLWLYVSYNEHMINFADRMLIIEVPADKNYQTNLDLRLMQASKMKDQLVKELEKRRNE